MLLTNDDSKLASEVGKIASYSLQKKTDKIEAELQKQYVMLLMQSNMPC
jgi:hypothetical protein